MSLFEQFKEQMSKGPNGLAFQAIAIVIGLLILGFIFFYPGIALAGMAILVFLMFFGIVLFIAFMFGTLILTLVFYLLGWETDD